MKKFIFTSIIAIALFPLCAIAAYKQNKENQKPPVEIELKNAVEHSIIDVAITGSYVPDLFAETVDQEGLHYGKCMAISVHNNIETPITVVMAAGTLLMPSDTDIQIMVATHDLNITLQPGESCYTNFYAMCTQMHKYTPTKSETFTVGKPADTTLGRLVKYLEKSFDQNFVGQHAVWAYTDSATEKDLAEYGADNNSLQLTRAILDASGLQTVLNYKAGQAVAVVPHHYNYWAMCGLILFAIAKLIGILWVKKQGGLKGLAVKYINRGNANASPVC